MSNGEMVPEVGIYAAVYVGPVPGKGNKRFFDQFQSRPLRDDLANGNLHVTTQYPEELISHGLASHELKKLPTVAGNITRQLGELGLIGVDFKVDEEQGVSGRKKWWTLSVHDDYNTLFDQCREVGARAVEADLSPIQLAKYSPDGYHISLVHRGRAGHDSLRTAIRPPNHWRILGTGVRVVSVGPDRSYRQSYINRPRYTSA